MLTSNSSEHGAIIVAGGSGKRFGTDLPKQFLELGGQPVLMHTIQRFYQTIQDIQIVVVLPDEHIDTWNLLCKKYNFNILHEVVSGGESRFQSVKNGLATLPQCETIAVQDGVRPLTPHNLIKNCFEEAKRHGSCVPVIPVTDSLRTGSFHQNTPVSRESLFRVQTPQVFRNAWIMQAYELAFDPSFTDDASVVEKAGHQIFLTQGAEENIKITQPKDLELAHFYLENNEP